MWSSLLRAMELHLLSDLFPSSVPSSLLLQLYSMSASPLDRHAIRKTLLRHFLCNLPGSKKQGCTSQDEGLSGWGSFAIGS